MLEYSIRYLERNLVGYLDIQQDIWLVHTRMFAWISRERSARLVPKRALQPSLSIQLSAIRGWPQYIKVWLYSHLQSEPFQRRWNVRQNFCWTQESWSRWGRWDPPTAKALDCQPFADKNACTYNTPSEYPFLPYLVRMIVHTILHKNKLHTMLTKNARTYSIRMSVLTILSQSSPTYQASAIPLPYLIFVTDPTDISV